MTTDSLQCPILKTRNYIKQFARSRCEDYLACYKDFNYRSYGNFFNFIEIHQLMLDIWITTRDELSNPYIPEYFPSPKSLIVFLLNFRKHLEKKGKLFNDCERYYNGKTLPTPITSVNSIRQEILSMLEYVLEQDEIQKYLKKNHSKQANINLNLNNNDVFVTYSWEDEKYNDLVISFTDFLRKKGFNAEVDRMKMQDETALHLPRMMENAILNFNKIIIILSKTYKKKAEMNEGGVGKEYEMISQDIRTNPKKYILVSFQTVSKKSILRIAPIGLQGREIIDLKRDEKNNFKKLFSKLTDKAPLIFSPVASKRIITRSKPIKRFKING